MALRGIAGQANSADSSSCIIDVSGIGIQNGDVVILSINGGGGSGVSTFTWPTGFAPISGLTQQTLATSTAFAVAMKIASSEPASYTITSTNSNFQSAQCRVYSGRSGTVTAQALTAATSFPSGTSPVTLAFTGLTAAASDDVVLFAAGDNENEGSAVPYAIAAPTGYGNVLNTIAAVAFSPWIGSFDMVDAPAGATGAIDAPFTWVTHKPVQYAGFLLSLAASASSPSKDQFFFGASLLPLAWVIERRQLLAKKRARASISRELSRHA